MDLRKALPWLLPIVLAACATPETYHQRSFGRVEEPGDGPTVAVADLTSHAEHPGAGAILAGLLRTELRGRGRVRVVTEPERADGVVRGEVTELGYQHGLHEEPVVGVTAWLERRCDNRTLWTASHAGVGESYFFRESVSQVAQRVARRLVDDLERGLGPQALECPGAPPEPEREVAREKLDIRFAPGSATLRQADRPELRRLAQRLRRRPKLRVRVEGHTDSVGNAAYNRELSRRRAANVRVFLVEEGGIDPARVETRGFGESKPVADNGTAQGRARNRRIEVVTLAPAPRSDAAKVQIKRDARQ